MIRSPVEAQLCWLCDRSDIANFLDNVWLPKCLIIDEVSLAGCCKNIWRDWSGS